MKIFLKVCTKIESEEDGFTRENVLQKEMVVLSKVNQIQKALSALSGGEFQKLADAFLVFKNYRGINSIGSKLGENKTKTGTPDTLFIQTNGKYIFVEHSTKSEGLYSKFCDDIDKCLDVDKVGIHSNKIELIILCHNRKLKPTEINQLLQKCLNYQIKLLIYGNETISFEIYKHYPSLARDFLGISIDSGQIVTIKEFVKNYDCNKIAAPLSTRFCNREEELKAIYEGLYDNDLIILRGKPGVGKSRLAIECCEKYAQENPLVKCYGIFHRGQDLFEDLKVYLSEPGEYLLLVDDANRIANFEYFIQYICENDELRKVKVIATVRDYARAQIESVSSKMGNFFEVEVNKFNNEEIEKIITSNYSINNPLYLDRIIKVSLGNIRIAVMASIIAKRENTLQSIYNVENVYDQYFSPIINKLESFESESLFKTAGIISFLRIIDFANVENINKVSIVFNIPNERLLKDLEILHRNEIVDMYIGEIAKVSDQVLCTYLFYLAFFKNKYYDLSLLLRNYFAGHNAHFIECINPIVQAFDSEMIVREIESHVKSFYKNLRAENRDRDELLLLDNFGQLLTTELLLYIKDTIGSIEMESYVTDELVFEDNKILHSGTFLSLFRGLQRCTIYEFKIGFSLLLEFYKKKPSKGSLVAKIIIDEYSFNQFSYASECLKESFVINELIERGVVNQDRIFTKLFLEIAPHYLKIERSFNEAGRGRSVIFGRYLLQATTHIKEIRQQILTGLVKLYGNLDYRTMVADIFQDLYKGLYKKDFREFIQCDFEILKSFYEKDIDACDFKLCKMADSYIKLLDRNGIELSESFRYKFQTNSYQLYKTIIRDRYAEEFRGMNYKEYEECCKSKLREFVLSKSEESVIDVLHLLDELFQQDIDERDEYQIKYGVSNIFDIIFVESKEKYSRIILRIIDDGLVKLLLEPKTVSHLIEALGFNKIYEMIMGSSTDWPDKWKFELYFHINKEDIANEHLCKLKDMYRTAELEQIPRTMQFVYKFWELDSDCIKDISKMIFKRSKNEPEIAIVLQDLFNKDLPFINQLEIFFADDLSLLDQIYLKIWTTHEHFDYKNQGLARLNSINKSFILKYIDLIFEKKWYDRYSLDLGPMDFIWNEEFTDDLVHNIISTIVVHESKVYYVRESLISQFFRVEDQDLVEFQNKFLKKYMSEFYDDENKMITIFKVISQFDENRRLKFINEFVRFNPDVEIFKKIEIKDDVDSWSGSAVPVIQRKIEYLERIKDLFDTVELLQHRIFIDERILGMYRWMESEKRRDFIGL